MACTNLFDTLCRCLCRNAVPDGIRLNSLHVLALEGVLAVRSAPALWGLWGLWRAPVDDRLTGLHVMAVLRACLRRCR